MPLKKVRRPAPQSQSQSLAAQRRSNAPLQQARSMEDTSLQIVISALPSILAAVAIVWRLGGKITALDCRFHELVKRIDKVDVDIKHMQNDIKEEFRSAREGRAHIWTEVNGLRERTSVIETRIAK